MTMITNLICPAMFQAKDVTLTKGAPWLTLTAQSGKTDCFATVTVPVSQNTRYVFRSSLYQPASTEGVTFNGMMLAARPGQWKIFARSDERKAGSKTLTFDTGDATQVELRLATPSGTKISWYGPMLMTQADWTALAHFGFTWFQGDTMPLN